MKLKMRKTVKVLLTIAVLQFAGMQVFAQGGGVTFQSGCPGVAVSGTMNGLGDTSVDCGNCVTLKAYAQATAPTASDYIMTQIPFHPPFAFNAGTELTGFTDDYYISILSLPFRFCFYDSIYRQVCVGSNGIISFDAANSGQYCPYSFYTGLPIPNTAFSSQAMNAVYGVYEDIYPWYNSDSTNGRVFQGVLGEYPCRKACFNYFHCAAFGNYTVKNTSQIVLYEGTNVIDIYIREHCYPASGGYPLTNNGEALVGIQNANGTKGMAPPNRNGGQWSTRQEAWRFTPTGSSSYTVRWYEGAGRVGLPISTQVINSDTAISRQLVCPMEPTWYTAVLEYTACNGDHFELMDSVLIGADPILRTRDTVCTNVPYMFGGILRDSTGIYSDTIRKVNIPDCDSVYKVLDLRFGTYATDTIYSCDRYVWRDGRTYTRSTDLPRDTLTNILGCDSVIALHLVMDYTSRDTIWDTICDDQNSYMFGTAYSRPGTYVDTMPTVMNGCDSIKVLYLTVIPKPSVVLNNAGYDCDLQAFTLIAETERDSSFYWYSSPYDLSLEGQESDSVIYISPRVSTTYSAVVSSGIPGVSCADTASIFVQYVPKLKATIQADPPVVHHERDQIRLTDITLGNTYDRVWTCEGLDRSDSARVTYYNFPKNQDSAWVSLKVRNEYYCYDSTTLVIPIEREEIWIPNAITPDLPTNKCFEVKGTGILEYVITIYDREGLAVFTSNDIYEKWNATSPDGRPCATGVYTYVLRYKGITDPSKYNTRTGSLLIVR